MTRDVSICSEVSYYDDDLVGFCAHCQCRLFVRPYSSKAAVRLCGRCGKKAMQADPNRAVVVLRASLADVQAYLRNKEKR